MDHATVTFLFFFFLNELSIQSSPVFQEMGVTDETTEASPVASVPSGQTSKKENVITKSVEKVKETTTVWPSILRSHSSKKHMCSYRNVRIGVHLLISFISFSSSAQY